ncbi:universal stress protein [Streptomyces carpaticus]
MMAHPIVVGIDGSESSLRAADWAVDAADRRGRALRMVYASFWEQFEVMSPSVGLSRPEGGMMARNVLAAAQQRASQRRPAVKVSVEVLTQPPIPALLEEAGSASMIVVGSRGRGQLAGLLLGTVGLGVAARATCPVVVVRGAEPAREGYFQRVLVGIKDVDRPAAVAFAFEEADARQCELRAVHAWLSPAEGGTGRQTERTAADVLARSLTPGKERHPDVRVVERPQSGVQRSALLTAAETADLLVLGAHRRATPVGLHLGLTSHALLQHAACPVAVVPEH